VPLPDARVRHPGRVRGSQKPDEAARCPRCGRSLIDNTPSGGEGYVPLPKEALCSYCLTGHGPAWIELPEPDWWFARWAKRSRFWRWVHSDHTYK
jgi:hypothetical protein